MKEVQNRKYLSTLRGKHLDISLEKFLTKIKIQKKQNLKKIKEGVSVAKDNAERMAYFKLKKEPEKNKTHWDHLIEEMKWMNTDFERERKLKKKKATDMSKFCKKSLETRHLDVEKKIRRQEGEIKKLSQTMSKAVSHYWKKIDKLTKHHYGVLLHENKMMQQQNRLLGVAVFRPQK